MDTEKIVNKERQPALKVAEVIGRFLCSVNIHWYKKTGHYYGLIVNGKYPERFTCKRCGKTKNVAFI